MLKIVFFLFISERLHLSLFRTQKLANTTLNGNLKSRIILSQYFALPSQASGFNSPSLPLGGYIVEIILNYAIPTLTNKSATIMPRKSSIYL